MKLELRLAWVPERVSRGVGESQWAPEEQVVTKVVMRVVTRVVLKAAMKAAMKAAAQLALEARGLQTV